MPTRVGMMPESLIKRPRGSVSLSHVLIFCVKLCILLRIKMTITKILNDSDVDDRVSLVWVLSESSKSGVLIAKYINKF